MKLIVELPTLVGGIVAVGRLEREETLKKLVETARAVQPEDLAEAERTVRECFSLQQARRSRTYPLKATGII